MNTLRLIFLLLVLASGVALRAEPASDHTPIHLQADIVYKTTAAGELHLDLFYPATELVGAYPLVVYTHGGGWAAGSKNIAQGRSSIARTVRGLTEAGFCVAAVQYRLCKNGETSIRDCVTDAMDAVRYLAKQGEALHLDASRVFTYGDSAGGNREAGYTYDGFSLKDVFLGKAKESKREWILAMGADPARMTDKGVQNVFYFRDRVVRDARFKLFIDTNRKPEKLIDLSQDPEEANNLMGNPEYADVFQRLTAIIDTLPKADNDRSYEPLALNAWDRKASHEADVHKRGIRVNP